MAEVTGLVIGSTSLVQRFLEATDWSVKDRNDPIIRETTTFMYLLNDCVHFLEKEVQSKDTDNGDSSMRMLEAVIADCASLGMQFSAREQSRHSTKSLDRVRWRLHDENLKKLHLEFKQKVTVLQSLIQGLVRCIFMISTDL